jgi:hypothetical protein
MSRRMREQNSLFKGYEINGSSDPAGNAPRTGIDDRQCAYVQNCTTPVDKNGDKNWRKVVSHIFGRNKLCTRQIPEYVWVCYCRKHYQRARYRNPQGFAQLQCDLVRTQIKRLEEWGGVRDWVVKLRKREAERLKPSSSDGTAKSPTKAEKLEENMIEDISAEKATDEVKVGPKGTVKEPEEDDGIWLLDLVGSSKTTPEILKILDRIEAHVYATTGLFPDVEILPNVVVSDPVTANRKTSKGKRPKLRNSTGSAKSISSKRDSYRSNHLSMSELPRYEPFDNSTESNPMRHPNLTSVNPNSAPQTDFEAGHRKRKSTQTFELPSQSFLTETLVAGQAAQSRRGSLHKRQRTIGSTTEMIGAISLQSSPTTAGAPPAPSQEWRPSHTHNRSASGAALTSMMNGARGRSIDEGRRTSRPTSVHPVLHNLPPPFSRHHSYQIESVGMRQF